MRAYELREKAIWRCFAVLKGISVGFNKTVGFSLRLFSFLLLSFVIAEHAPAIAGYFEEKKLMGVGGDSVAIGGNWIVVGAPAEGGTGAAYVYRYENSTWVREQKLAASAPQLGDEFGASVAINSAGNRIVVGAPGRNQYKGSAYVFRLDLGSDGLPYWSEEQEITALDGAMQDRFGLSTAISDFCIVIGSPLEGGSSSNRGAVYVYEFIFEGGWVEKQKLVAPENSDFLFFGWSVAIEGNWMVAGAIQDMTVGSAYVINKKASGSWEFETKLEPLDDDRITGGLFGHSVSISLDRIVVGARFASPGYASVFRYIDPQWEWEQKIKLMDETGVGEFGSAVAIAGEQIVVGAPGSDSGRGAAYLFGLGADNTWIPEQILTDPYASAGFRFGRSVSIADDLIVAGAPGSDAAFVFRFTPDSDGDGVPDEEDQCPGTPSWADVDANGCALSQLDTDGDGVSDDLDQCPSSDIRPTVIIATCDSGIANMLFSEPAGCTITDEIMKLADGAKSHGQFVSKVDKFLLELQKAGILEPNEKNAIRDCAAQSNLP